MADYVHHMIKTALQLSLNSIKCHYFVCLFIIYSFYMALFTKWCLDTLIYIFYHLKPLTFILFDVTNEQY